MIIATRGRAVRTRDAPPEGPEGRARVQESAPGEARGFLVPRKHRSRRGVRGRLRRCAPAPNDESSRAFHDYSDRPIAPSPR
eukprot:31391-Pelagococcus_subviridis.AAC.5